MQSHANLIFLFRQLLARELALKYKTTVLGALWLVLLPILMLCVYTLVFSGIFKARWAGAQNSGDFALMLFAGLIPFSFLSEVLITSPTLVVGQPNFVKRWSSASHARGRQGGGGLVTAAISLLILLMAQAFLSEAPSAKALLAPVILLEMVPMLLAIGWILSALGVYLRDVGQFVGILSSVLLFLSPIFFPPSAMPASVSGLIAFNPWSP